MVSTELVKRIEDKVLDTLLLAQNKFGQPFELPKISFELNGKCTAGLAQYYLNQIKINTAFLLHDPDDMINVTVPHEIAHLITFKLYPRAKQGHGPEWKSVMIALGLRPDPYHDMRLPGTEAREIQFKPWFYTCRCLGEEGIHFLSNCLHNRILEGQIRKCRICKSRITFVCKRLMPK